MKYKAKCRFVPKLFISFTAHGVGVGMGVCVCVCRCVENSREMLRIHCFSLAMRIRATFSSLTVNISSIDPETQHF